MLSELKAIFPNSAYIPRLDQINAWDSEEFVKAVKATGKNQLVISGIGTNVCVTFVALSTKETGFDVFVVTDVSDTFTSPVREAFWMRMQQAGVQLVN